MQCNAIIMPDNSINLWARSNDECQCNDNFRPFNKIWTRGNAECPMEYNAMQCNAMISETIQSILKHQRQWWMSNAMQCNGKLDNSINLSTRGNDECQMQCNAMISQTIQQNI